MEGFLEKKSNRKVLNRFQKRFFRLQWTKLSYFSRKEDDAPKGHIDLHEMHGIYLVNTDTQRRTFVLLLANKSTFLVASNPAEAQAWVRNLTVFSRAPIPAMCIPPPRHVKKSILALLDVCLRIGTSSEGLFRVSGRSKTVSNICRAVYMNYPQDEKELLDVESVAGAIKRLVMALPETLLSNARAKKFSESSDVDEVKALMRQLPQDNRDILKELFHLFKLVCDNFETTKMKPKALAICFAPGLSGAELALLFDMNSFFDLCISNFDSVFDISVMDSKEGMLPLMPQHGGHNRTPSITDLARTPSAELISRALRSSGDDGNIMSKLRAVKSRLTTVSARVTPPSNRPTILNGVKRIDSHSARNSDVRSLGHFFSTPHNATPPNLIKASNTTAELAALTRSSSPAISSPLPQPKDRIVDPIPASVQLELQTLKSQVAELQAQVSYWRRKAAMNNQTSSALISIGDPPPVFMETRAPALESSSKVEDAPPVSLFANPSSLPALNLRHTADRSMGEPGDESSSGHDEIDNGGSYCNGDADGYSEIYLNKIVSSVMPSSNTEIERDPNSAEYSTDDAISSMEDMEDVEINDNFMNHHSAAIEQALNNVDNALVHHESTVSMSTQSISSIGGLDDRHRAARNDGTFMSHSDIQDIKARMFASIDDEYPDEAQKHV